MKPQLASATVTAPLRVLSFNIQLGLRTARGLDYLTQGWRHALPARSIAPGLRLAAEAMRGYDFVAVQEADAGSLRSARIDQIAFLAEHGGYAFHGRAVTRDLAPVARHCLGFLSRWPARIVADHALPGLIPGRRMIHVEVQSPSGPVAIHVVHLALGSGARYRQLGYVASRVDLDTPSILMGDFNCDADVLRRHPALQRAGFHIYEQDHPTFPSWAPRRAIDHILTSPHLRIEHVQALPRLHSDHLPLMAQIAFCTPP